MPPHRPEGPSRRAFEQLSSEHKEWVREIAARMERKESYFAAVRQVLANARITHEPDVNRLMKTFSQPVDEVRTELRREAADQAEEEAEIFAAIAEEREQALLADMERIRRERGGDPED